MDNSADRVVWDLKDLYEGKEDPRIESDRAWCIEKAESFAKTYAGRVAQLSPADLRAALSLLEELEEKCDRIASFAYLNFVTQTQDAAAGAFWQSAQELETQIQRRVLFFGLEWSRLSDAQARVMSDDGLASFRHHLEKIRMYSPHRLSEPEEQILEALSLSGRKAWVTLFDKLMGQMGVGRDGRTLSQALSDLYRPDRESRRSSALEITAGLEKILPLTTHIHNALSLDKSIRDDLLSFPHWLRNMNIRNELADEQVEVLVRSVTSRYDIVQDYYALKKTILGYSDLRDYDRYAPLSVRPQKKIAWEEAKERIMAVYEAFSPEAARVIEMFFAGRWIHAATIPGKPGGAFSHPTVPSCHPYISLNFTGTQRDVMTLAHELGHGIHQYLCREQGLFNTRVPLTMAETASIFSEMLVFDALLEDAGSDEEALAMLCGKLEDLFSTTFRQISMNRFEDAIHRERRKAGELSAERLSALWMSTQQEMFGTSLNLGEHYRLWWSYIPHFIHTPGYVYAYAFAELTALCLLQQYRSRGSAFVPLYLDLLRAGSRAAPHDLLKSLGLDISDPSFYKEGLTIMEDMVEWTKRRTVSARKGMPLPQGGGGEAKGPAPR